MKGMDIRKSRMGLFGVRNNCDEAMEYALELGKNAGMEPVHMLTAIGVYHNTLVEALAKSADKGDLDEQKAS